MRASARAAESGSSQSFVQKRRGKFLVSSLVMLALAVSLYNYHAISSAFTRTQSFYDARQLTQSMVESLFREESSLRGYTSTRDPEYLRPYVDARIGFARQSATLRDYLSSVGLANADPYLRDIARVHDQWVATVAEPLVRNPAGELAQSRQRTGELLFSTLSDDVGWLSEVLDEEAQAAAKSARLSVIFAI